MKVIFLDIDGVLNGYNKWNLLGWKLICKFKCNKLRLWYRNITEPFGVHKRKVKLLAKIVKKTNAKIVMSSCWRKHWWNTPYDEQDKDERRLTDLFKKYNIEVIDITPNFHNGKRDDEIISWINNHLNILESYIILDDENSFITAYWHDKRFIQTSNVPIGKIVNGSKYEDTGLKRKHVKQAIKVLNNIK